MIITVMNLSDQFWKEFPVAIESGYTYSELINSDWEKYHGQTKLSDQNYRIETVAYRDKDAILRVDLAPFSARIFKCVDSRNKKII